LVGLEVLRTSLKNHILQWFSNWNSIIIPFRIFLKELQLIFIQLSIFYLTIFCQLLRLLNHRSTIFGFPLNFLTLGAHSTMLVILLIPTLFLISILLFSPILLIELVLLSLLLLRPTSLHLLLDLFALQYFNSIQSIVLKIRTRLPHIVELSLFLLTILLIIGALYFFE